MNPRTRIEVALVCTALALGVIQVGYAQGTLQRVLSALGITVNPGQAKAPGDAYASGDIFLARPDNDTPRQLTGEGGYRSPVFGGAGEILALKGETLVSIPGAGGAAQELRTIKGVHRLLGVNRDNPEDIVALIEHDGTIVLATVARAGSRIERHAHDPSSTEEATLLAALQEDARDYGSAKLYLKTQTKQGPTGRAIEWTDVYLKRGNAAPENVSRCDATSCVQPAWAPESGAVVFVKSRD